VIWTLRHSKLVTSSNIRFIRIEVSGMALVYILMLHYANHSLVIPFTSGLSYSRPHHLSLFSTDSCCLGKSAFLPRRIFMPHCIQKSKSKSNQLCKQSCPNSHDLLPCDLSLSSFKISLRASKLLGIFGSPVALIRKNFRCCNEMPSSLHHLS
jgi:hypothetical protein